MFGKTDIIESNVFKKSKTKGYVKVHIAYLITELDWIKKNTKLTGGLDILVSPSVFIVDHLLHWMSRRKKPFWDLLGKEEDYTKWVDLQEDHWIVNHDVRNELLNKGLI